MEYLHTIEPCDVGKIRIEKRCPYCGGHMADIFISSLMGKILPRDIGKRIYLVDGVYQVENDEQLAKRLKNEP